MAHKLYGKTIESTKDVLKQHFQTSEKKSNIENVKVKICLICQCALWNKWFASMTFVAYLSKNETVALFIKEKLSYIIFQSPNIGRA